jgi:hypothetical protein
MRKYAIDYNINIKWIFLESGHGKGVSDAVGATIKCTFDKLIAYNPDDTFSNALDLINGVRNNTNIKLYFYNSSNITNPKKQIPQLKSVKGTGTFHKLIASTDGKLYAKTVSNEHVKLLKEVGAYTLRAFLFYSSIFLL